MSERKPGSKAPRAHDYKRAREQTRRDVREAAVDAAIELLEDGGPSAVTVRAVAERVGASTQVIYTLFGGKPGLAGAVFGRGHQLLAEAQREVERSDDPLADMRELGRAYRRRALAEPQLYQAMFAKSLGEMEPDAEAMEAAAASFGELSAAVSRCQEAGQLQAGDPIGIARVIFCGVHGACSLQLTGRHPPDLDPDAVYEHLPDTLLSGLGPVASPATPRG
jgi:AcrR family transcriptional regulator